MKCGTIRSCREWIARAVVMAGAVTSGAGVPRIAVTAMTSPQQLYSGTRRTGHNSPLPPVLYCPENTTRRAARCSGASLTSIQRPLADHRESAEQGLPPVGVPAGRQRMIALGDVRAFVRALPAAILLHDFAHERP